MRLINIVLDEAKEYQQYPDDYKPNFHMNGMDDFKVGGTRLPIGTSFYSDEEKAEFKKNSRDISSADAGCASHIWLRNVVGERPQVWHHHNTRDGYDQGSQEI